MFSRILGALLGLAFTVVGLLIFKRRKQLASVADASYSEVRSSYDKYSLGKKGLSKVLAFLFFKPRSYYMKYSAIFPGLLFISSLLVILGITLILASVKI
jgi:hypothetical protein